METQLERIKQPLTSYTSNPEKTEVAYMQDSEGQVNKTNLQHNVFSFLSWGAPTVSSSHHGCWDTETIKKEKIVMNNQLIIW